MLKVRSASQQLCLQCGLCCDGSLFSAVELQRPDRVEQLKSLGMRVRVYQARHRMLQPCSALNGCECRLYAERPKYCRDFHCEVLKGFQSGALTEAAALKKIRKAVGLVKRIRAELRALGNAEENRPLRKRFERLSRDLESRVCPPDVATRYADVSRKMHQLNWILSTDFYPSPGDLTND